MNLVHSKPSLRAFSFVIVSWVLLRLALNVPLTAVSPTPVIVHEGIQQNHAEMAQLEPRSEKPLKSAVTEKMPPLRLAGAELVLKNPHRNPPARHLVAAPNVTTIRAESRGSIVSESLITRLADQSLSNPLPKAPTHSDRLSLSGWLLLRPESLGQTIATAGQLGGSQTGAKVSTRLTWLGHTTELNGFIRATTALTPVTAGEAAIGVSLRHTARFVSEIQIERRIKLSDGGRSDFALVASTSIYEVPIAPLIKLEGYAQGGVVGLKARDLFIDGSVKVDRRLIESKSSAFSAGVGVWAAAQPDVHRIDVGPHITLKQRVANGTIRISGEWRFRVKGNARPSSGPSLSAGFDF